ncbi:MAG: class I SAM-dependent methyltransferase [Parvularculaceae bacterium]
MALTGRQQREIDYHRDYAAAKAAERLAPVNFDVVNDAQRRPQNAFWSAYDRLLAHDLTGKRALVPGCGFGEDAIRLGRLGAAVDAFDISPDVVEIARRRCAEFGYGGVMFGVMPSEALSYPDNSFDLVVFIDILHHVDIPAAMQEVVRVLKPGGRIVGNELYTHSWMQKTVRESWLVEKALYPMMRRFIYGAKTPYITPDEHKIDETEFAAVEAVCASIDAEWFNGVVGRLVPDRVPLVAGADRALMKTLGARGRYAAGRVVFEGIVAKE